MSSLATRLILGVVLGVCLLATGTVLWRHYSGLIDAKAELSAQVRGLESDVAREKSRADAFQKSIGSWEAAAKLQAEALDELTRAQREAGAYSRELKDVLSKHDLGALAKAKPQLIENRINTGTSRSLRLLERASQGPAADVGAPAAEPRTAGPKAP